MPEEVEPARRDGLGELLEQRGEQRAGLLGGELRDAGAARVLAELLLELDLVRGDVRLQRVADLAEEVEHLAEPLVEQQPRRRVRRGVEALRHLLAPLVHPPVALLLEAALEVREVLDLGEVPVLAERVGVLRGVDPVAERVEELLVALEEDRVVLAQERLLLVAGELARALEELVRAAVAVVDEERELLEVDGDARALQRQRRRLDLLDLIVDERVEQVEHLLLERRLVRPEHGVLVERDDQIVRVQQQERVGLREPPDDVDEHRRDLLEELLHQVLRGGRPALRRGEHPALEELVVADGGDLERLEHRRDRVLGREEAVLRRLGDGVPVLHRDERGLLLDLPHGHRVDHRVAVEQDVLHAPAVRLRPLDRLLVQALHERGELLPVDELEQRGDALDQLAEPLRRRLADPRDQPRRGLQVREELAVAQHQAVLLAVLLVGEDRLQVVADQLDHVLHRAPADLPLHVARLVVLLPEEVRALLELARLLRDGVRLLGELQHVVELLDAPLREDVRQHARLEHDAAVPRQPLDLALQPPLVRAGDLQPVVRDLDLVDVLAHELDLVAVDPQEVAALLQRGERLVRQRRDVRALRWERDQLRDALLLQLRDLRREARGDGAVVVDAPPREEAVQRLEVLLVLLCRRRGLARVALVHQRRQRRGVDGLPLKHLLARLGEDRDEVRTLAQRPREPRRLLPLHDERHPEGLRLGERDALERLEAEGLERLPPEVALDVLQEVQLHALRLPRQHDVVAVPRLRLGVLPRLERRDADERLDHPLVELALQSLRQRAARRTLVAADRRDRRNLVHHAVQQVPHEWEKNLSMKKKTCNFFSFFLSFFFLFFSLFVTFFFKELSLSNDIAILFIIVLNAFLFFSSFLA